MIKLYGIIGKSGSGKDTIASGVRARIPSDRLHWVVPTTTRPKRENEEYGREYYFISEKEFFMGGYEGCYATHQHFNEWGYGILWEELYEDKPNITILNPSSMLVLDKYPQIDLITFEIYTSQDKTRLFRQLLRETNPNVAEICRRYLADEHDFDKLSNYITNYCLHNNNYNDLINNIKYITQIINSDYERLGEINS